MISKSFIETRESIRVEDPVFTFSKSSGRDGRTCSAKRPDFCQKKEKIGKGFGRKFNKVGHYNVSEDLKT